MTTFSDLIGQIQALGIQKDDTVTLHTSLKAIGEIDYPEKTGADAVLDAFCQCLPNGLFLVPSHTFSNVRRVPVFDVQKTLPCIGTLPTVAVQRANAAHARGDLTCIRSLHPAHSMVAFGKNAVSYTDDDRNACTPMPEFGCYRKLYTHHAKILLIGVGLTNNTFIHAIDEYMEPNGVSAPYPVTAIDYDGSSTLRQVCNAHGPSGTYGKYLPVLTQWGAVTYGKLGNADVMVCDAVKTFDAIVSVWKELNPRP